ncbi:MAG: heme exporter protein CcmB [Terrabacter sp.]
MTIARVALAVAVKDLRVELRSRSSMGTVIPFAATMLIAFGFALGPGRTLLLQTAPGLLWLAVLFAALEVFHRAYLAETDADALEGLLLAPVDKGAIYLGKAAAAAAQLMLLLCLTAAMVLVLFGLPLSDRPALLALTFVLGVVGLAAVGSLFGLLAAVGRTRRAAVPVLVLPLLSPVVIAAIRSTDALTGGAGGDIGGWLGLLGAFDAIFLATGFLVFGHVLED